MVRYVVDRREDRPDTQNDDELPMWLRMCDHMGDFYVCPAYKCVACSAKRKILGEVQQVFLGPARVLYPMLATRMGEFVSICDPAYVTVEQGRAIK